MSLHISYAHAGSRAVDVAGAAPRCWQGRERPFPAMFLKRSPEASDLEEVGTLLQARK